MPFWSSPLSHARCTFTNRVVIHYWIIFDMFSMHVSDNQILIYTCIFCMFRIHVSDNENLEKVFPNGDCPHSQIVSPWVLYILSNTCIFYLLTSHVWVDQKIDKYSTYIIFCIHILLGLRLGSGQTQQNGQCWGWDSQALRINLDSGRFPGLWLSQTCVLYSKKMHLITIMYIRTQKDIKRVPLYHDLITLYNG